MNNLITLNRRLSVFVSPKFSNPTQQITFARKYHERVIEHYEKPRNVGSFKKEDPNVGTGILRFINI